MRPIGIFTEVDPNNREELMAKASAAARVLRIVALVDLVFAALIALLAFVGFGTVGLFFSAFSPAAAAVGTGLAFLVVIFRALFSIIVPAIMYWYTKNLILDLEADIIPNIGIAFVFLALCILSIIVKPSILRILIYLFFGYLWYVIIDCVKKVENKYVN